MKNLVVVLFAVAAMTLSNQTKAQVMEVSGAYLYGVFTDDYSSGIYDSATGFDLAGVYWAENNIGYGLFVKSISASGVPYTVNATGTSEISMFAWGPQISYNYKFMDIYARYGFLSLEEYLYSSIGNKSFEGKGNNFDLGVRVRYQFTDRVLVYIKGEHQSTTLKDVDADGMVNMWIAGVGFLVKF